MGTSFVLYDGTSAVSLSPEYDYKIDHRKVENSHRTRSGRLYKYKWGEFKQVKFSAEFLSSSDMCKVNSWWGSNTPLRLYDTGSSVVVSGYLSNNATPINQLQRPYTDQFKGVIELESY